MLDDKRYWQGVMVRLDRNLNEAIEQTDWLAAECIAVLISSLNRFMRKKGWV